MLTYMSVGAGPGYTIMTLAVTVSFTFVLMAM